MIRTKVGQDKKVVFESIAELVEFNRHTERTNKYKNYHTSDEKGEYKTEWTKTKSYEEAEDLLLHGWGEMAEKLTVKVGNINNANNFKNKTIYDVQGFQCSVPRYLQGIPTNMVNKKSVPVKQKVINIVKDFGYNASTSAKQIEDESIKVLKVVQALESKGQRVNLFITFVSRERGYFVEITLKIKNASQRLNIKQTAFPLVHPSMFRRILFGTIERLEESKNFGTGYGWCTGWEETKHLFKGSYYIPRIVKEQEITDIQKYYIE